MVVRFMIIAIVAATVVAASPTVATAQDRYAVADEYRASCQVATDCAARATALWPRHLRSNQSTSPSSRSRTTTSSHS